MSDCTWCPSCCPRCFTFNQLAATSDSPFSLRNLLLGGTLTLDKARIGVVHQKNCVHRHEEDGWHAFQSGWLIQCLQNSAEDLALIQGLAFLILHNFVRATCRGDHHGRLVLRIYLVQFDLSNVQGRLRVRKENILSAGRRHMRTLLPKLSQSLDKWLCREIVSSGEEKRLIKETIDTRTLADIYSDLACPSPIAIPGLGNIASRLLAFDDSLDGLGMRSTLYRYQRRSVASMLQKELDTRDVPDPLFIQVKSVDDKIFYVQPGTLEILKERPMITPCRGGILCEELGTGKTVMMLSLIVATRKQISSPEPSIVDDRPVMTPLAFRHFPGSEFDLARKRMFAGTNPYCEIDEVLSNNRYRRNLEKEDEVNTLPLGKMIRANVPFYHHYLGEPSNRERAQRNRLDERPKVIYLTSATLVVVPPNLLSQWDREITKHCELALRVLILRTSTIMPNARSLATNYDIILMSYTRFTSEFNNSDVTKLHSDRPCTCPEYPGFRVPNCKCPVPNISPFLQIRWKRLVIDEGHVSSSLTSILVPFAKLLSVERRWIVTGTPTTNLLGLSLGNRSSDDGNELQPDGAAGRPDQHFPVDVDDSPSMQISPSIPDDFGQKPRIWNRYDREDLNKLGNMITHFIALPQFTAEPKLMSNSVVEPLLTSTGPQPGAIQVLNQLMEMVMIRHRIEEVEKEVVLPPVSQESVLLDLDPLVIKSFNALQAIITINAIDSQRTDQDYMFHPRNADFLQATVRNMSQIFFWHVDEELYNAKQLLQSAAGHIVVAQERNVPHEDMLALNEAFRHLQIAMDDELWRQIQTHEEIPFRVLDLDQRVFDAWTRTPGSEPLASPDQTGFVHADRLLKLYDMVIQKPLIKIDDMVSWGQTVAARDKIFRQAYEESLRKKGKGRRKAKHADDLTSSSQMADNFAKKASAADTLKEMQKELDATLARLQNDDDDDGTSANNSEVGSPTKRPSNLVASSPLAKVRIASSASTKLNYIINEVQQYSSTEKFLIFSESPLSLSHVAEALELIHVKFLRFTSQVTSQFREQLVLTFETSETYRVFLMELKHGARGLNLISASRVIFCEPVWQADVESQAIKRAHRIGQTRPITVKTLAIRGTAEENMVARRTILKNSQEKLPKVIEEAGMRHYIANPKFITRPPTLSTFTTFPLIDLPPEFSRPRPNPIMLKIPAVPRTPISSLKHVRVEDPIPNPAFEGPAQKKMKGRSIRFADP
ncbi:hypothetical protein M413DRAFT_437870 [Hebeloma cylindrosporum]|uniref:Helicase C-terminal domain-containing protein n=1 Tax=Hebeloma cylindrosporum TaxID=76867 RepID=A0A0C3CJ22_HEBCY|nr:hypothetical protein M413DRAFT_437870 [Hebeloma cylindrosporum h7]